MIGRRGILGCRASRFELSDLVQYERQKERDRLRKRKTEKISRSSRRREILVVGPGHRKHSWTALAHQRLSFSPPSFLFLPHSHLFSFFSCSHDALDAHQTHWRPWQCDLHIPIFVKILFSLSLPLSVRSFSLPLFSPLLFFPPSCSRTTTTHRGRALSTPGDHGHKLFPIIHKVLVFASSSM